MQGQFAQTESDNPFLSVKEAAALAKSTAQTFYVYLSNTGSAGGKSRRRFPKDVYVRLGKRVLFIRQRFVDWLLSGATFE